MNAFVHVPKTKVLCMSQPGMRFSPNHLNTEKVAEYKNHNQSTQHGEQRERMGEGRGELKKYKSLPLFRLVAAVVCCLVFPLWVN